jgi:hypothetical protein
MTSTPHRKEHIKVPNRLFPPTGSNLTNKGFEISKTITKSKAM